MCTVNEFIAPVRILLDRFGQHEVELIHILRDAEELLAWLFDHRDTNEFNELIRVCRSLTDDALLLQVCKLFSKFLTLMQIVLRFSVRNKKLFVPIAVS